MTVCEPATALPSATNVTTPVAGLRVNTPSPATAMTLSASHVVVAGTYRQVAVAPVVCNCVPVASPEAPVIDVYVAVPFRSTDRVWAVATGAIGAVTVGVIVASTY